MPCSASILWQSRVVVVRAVRFGRAGPWDRTLCCPNRRERVASGSCPCAGAGYAFSLACCRYSEGVLPVTFLKIVLKVDFELNPASSAMDRIVM